MYVTRYFSLMVHHSSLYIFPTLISHDWLCGIYVTRYISLMVHLSSLYIFRQCTNLSKMLKSLLYIVHCAKSHTFFWSYLSIFILMEIQNISVISFVNTFTFAFCYWLIDALPWMGSPFTIFVDNKDIIIHSMYWRSKK